jgi:acylphosphatase
VSGQRARLHAVVRGDVQGVGFRYFVRRRARAAGLAGWVRNREDGAVECVAEGERGALEQLLAELKEGPSGAQVEDVQADWGEPGGENGEFRVVS